MKKTYRTLFIDYVRLLLEDQDKKIFSDDELKSLIDKHTDSQQTVTNVTAYSNKYHLNCCCSSEDSEGITGLTLESGYDDNGAYLLDEWAGIIIFDVADPDNTGTPPVDGSSITVSYFEVNLAELMAELCFILSHSTLKLVTVQSISGLSIDTSQLSKTYHEQYLRWKVQADNRTDEGL